MDSPLVAPPPVTLLVCRTLDHPRGPIRFLASSLAWTERTGPCLGCLHYTPGACGYQFPRGAHRTYLCYSCLLRLQTGDAYVEEAVAAFGRTLGDYPWALVSEGPSGASRHATYRCRWTGRLCRRLGSWKGGGFVVLRARPGMVLDAQGRETGERVAPEEFA